MSLRHTYIFSTVRNATFYSMFLVRKKRSVKKRESCIKNGRICLKSIFFFLNCVSERLLCMCECVCVCMCLLVVPSRYRRSMHVYNLEIFVPRSYIVSKRFITNFIFDLQYFSYERSPFPIKLIFSFNDLYIF